MYYHQLNKSVTHFQMTGLRYTVHTQKKYKQVCNMVYLFDMIITWYTPHMHKTVAVKYKWECIAISSPDKLQPYLFLPI